MNSFNELSLPKILENLLTQQKFTVPTKVQTIAIPLAMEGKDVVASSQTGSGKTLAYIIPILAEIINNPNSKALVLAPTRELAKQISDVARVFIEKLRDTRVTLIVGGTDMKKQIRALKNYPQLIIATPGRLNDHLRRKNLNLNDFKFLVLDEGDRMLDMGFAPQIDQIFKFLPKEKQTLLYTATMPKKIQNLVSKYMVKPEYVSVGATSQAVSSVKQRAVFITKTHKEDLLIDELNKQKGSVIIFLKTKRGTDALSKSLKGIGFKVSKIHGDRSQGQRNKAIQNFRNDKNSILCATDVSARGIDVPEVRLVVNYDPPVMEEDYIHRIGRTARNGASGEALSILLPSEKRIWLNIQKKYKAPEPEMPTDPEILKALKKAVLSGSSRSSGRNNRGGRSHARGNGGGGSSSGYSSRGGRGSGARKRSNSRSGGSSGGRSKRSYN